ncbi:hypothetical protein [uncultured Bilophila sp.]|uniref:hypothetical protein n=1 Tax=uncultured Bilophila sp. TaxID=529385 RepID=UPI0025DE6BB8|nr:hypothetical protein [uncultured Bilophila sp.]
MDAPEIRRKPGPGGLRWNVFFYRKRRAAATFFAAFSGKGKLILFTEMQGVR